MDVFHVLKIVQMVPNRATHHIFDGTILYCQLVSSKMLINPFHATDLFLYSLKASENLGFLIFSEGIEQDQWLDMA